MLELINMKIIAKLLDAWEAKAVKYKALSIAVFRYWKSAGGSIEILPLLMEFFIVFCTVEPTGDSVNYIVLLRIMFLNLIKYKGLQKKEIILS